MYGINRIETLDLLRENRTNIRFSLGSSLRDDITTISSIRVVMGYGC